MRARAPITVAGATNNLLLRIEGSQPGLIEQADTPFALLHGVGATLTGAIFLMMKNPTPDS
jgi:hypothetical protein